MRIMSTYTLSINIIFSLQVLLKNCSCDFISIMYINNTNSKLVHPRSLAESLVK